MKRILIVGYGNIGKKLSEEYKSLDPDIYDPWKGFNKKSAEKYDFAFICVDTPSKENGECDLSQVIESIKETNAEIVVLRSTVPPKTTEYLKETLGRRIVFSPEFYGTTQHSDEHLYDFNFTVLGGDKKDTEEVVQLLQHVYNGNHRFCFTDSTTAELTKYFENAMLATKVSLCCQFYDIAQQFGVNYSEMRELLLQDSRFNRSHTFVYKDHPYWESHCLDKDMSAITHFSNAPLIEEIIKYNESNKKHTLRPE